MDSRPVFRFRANSSILAQIYKIMKETRITVSSCSSLPRLETSCVSLLIINLIFWIHRISTVSLPAGSQDIQKARNQEMIFKVHSVNTANMSLRIVPPSIRFICIICFLVSLYINNAYPEYSIRRFCLNLLSYRFPLLNTPSIPMFEWSSLVALLSMSAMLLNRCNVMLIPVV